MVKSCSRVRVGAEAARGRGAAGRAGRARGPGRCALRRPLSSARAAARSSRQCRLGVVEARRRGRGGVVGAKEAEEKEEEEEAEGLGPDRGGSLLACALAFPEEAGSSAAAAAAVNGVMWIRGGTEQLLSQRIYRIRSQLIGSAGLHSLTLQRPPALRAAGGIQKGNHAAPRVPRPVLPPRRRHAGCPRGRAGHGGVSLSSFKETLTLRFPQRPRGRAVAPADLGNFLPATRKRE